MEDNVKMSAMAEIDRSWAELRDNSEKLKSLINKSIGKDASFSKDASLSVEDAVLFYQCLSVVMSEIILHEDRIMDFPDDELKSIKDNNPVTEMIRAIKDAALWISIQDESLPAEIRMEAIESFRKKVWARMAIRKDKIASIVFTYPKLTSVEDVSILVQCVALTQIELSLRQKEIDLI